MATIFSHAVFATALGAAFMALPMKEPPVRFWILAGICAALPDADVIGFAFGIRYGDLLGHRGLSHSILFALLIGWLVVKVCFRESVAGVRKSALVFFFFLATISHGCLDALTNGGLGVAFFAPLENTRYFFSWRPIEVSPLGAQFFSERGMMVLLSELRWVWGPSLIIVAVCTMWRRRAREIAR